MRKDARLFSSCSFWLDKGTLRGGDNFWSDFLRLIVLVVKAFQRQEKQFSPRKNMQQEQRSLLDGMNRLAMGTILSMVLQSFSSFAEHSLHAYTLPSTAMGSRRQPKTGSRLVGQRRRLQKPSMGTRGQGWAANRTQYIDISHEMSSRDRACIGHGSLVTFLMFFILVQRLYIP